MSFDPNAEKVAGPLPSAMLTKTHCKGFQVYEALQHSADVFWKTCKTTADKVGGVRKPVMNNTLVSHTIHLIRDPFDNIVARMHFEKAFNHSRKGLLGYCDKVDKIRRPALVEAVNVLNASAATKKQILGLPCLHEWYRWTHWHNSAVAATSIRRIPVHHVHYKSYSTDYNQTLQSIMHFLQLSAVHEPLPFKKGKSYKSFYSDKELILATRVIQSQASPSLWKLIRHYFENITDTPDWDKGQD